jgi:hypothetical protein
MPLLKPYSLNASVRNLMELWKLVNSPVIPTVGSLKKSIIKFTLSRDKLRGMEVFFLPSYLFSRNKLLAIKKLYIITS